MITNIKDIVAALDEDLLERHGSDMALFAELADIQRASGILHGSRPISPFLRPYFLERSRYEAIRHAARVLSGAFESLTAAALESDEMMAELGMSEKEARWARLEPGYKGVSVNSRLDTFLTADGFAFLEYNGENPAGIGDQTALESLFTHVPPVKDFLSANEHQFPQPHVRLLDVLLSSYREFGGKKPKPNIAIVDWDGVSTSPEFTILKDYFETKGHSTKICDPGELEFRKDRLSSGEFEIDIFFKRVIIHEFLERFDEEHPLYLACQSGSICMANSFRSKVPHKKAGFAVLTDEKYSALFTAEQLAVISQHVPWTRTVRDERTTRGGEMVGLLEFIRTGRERFVLKPNDEYGGSGISFGWESTAAEWDDAIEHALASHYLVQERVPVEKTEIPIISEGTAKIAAMTVDFDPFLFRGEVEGGMARLAAGSLVNITSGGGETALAILEGF